MVKGFNKSPTGALVLVVELPVPACVLAAPQVHETTRDACGPGVAAWTAGLGSTSGPLPGWPLLQGMPRAMAASESAALRPSGTCLVSDGANNVEGPAADSCEERVPVAVEALC